MTYKTNNTFNTLKVNTTKKTSRDGKNPRTLTNTTKKVTQESLTNN